MLRNRWRRVVKLWKGNLRTKIIASSFVPTAIILLAVALVTLFALQSTTEELVLERDREVTYVSANQLAAKLGEFEDRLTALARSADIRADDPAAQRDALKRASNSLAVFDGGVLLLDAFGKVVATEPERQVVDQDWSDRSYYQEVLRSQIVGASADPVLSDIVADGPDGADVVAFTVPIIGEQDRFQGMLVGMFRVAPIANNALYATILRLRIAESGNTYLVDSSGRVIYHSDADRIGEDFGGQPAVQEALGGQVDAIRTQDFAGQEIVAGYSPVAGTPWGLVTEEAWAKLTSGYRRYTNFLIFLLALGVVVPAIVVYVGVSRITEPIRQLMRAAQEVARGNFGQTITAETGDEVEELARRFNLMSAELQASYTNLEQKVAHRTRELATLNAIAAVVSRSLDLGEILEDALEQTLAMLEVEAGSILLFEPDGEVLTPWVHRGFSEDFLAAVPHVRLDEGIAGQAVARGKPVVLDVERYRTERLAPLLIKEGLHTLVSTPLLHTGAILGVMTLATRRPRAFPPQELELLTAIGQQIGVAVENARLYEQTQRELSERQRAEEELRRLNEERTRRNRELVLLNRVIAATTSQLEIKAVLEAVCRELTLAFDVPSAAAALLDEGGATLTVTAEYRSEERPSAMGHVIPIAGNPATQYVLEHRAPLAVADAQGDPRMAPVHDLMRERGVVSLLILPLIVHGQVVATLGLDAIEVRDFTDEEISLGANAAAATAQALENARAEEKVRESEERLKLAMEGADVGLWDQNLAIGEHIVIEDWTERLGFDPEELAPTYENWYQRVHPDDKPKLEAAWAKYASGKAPLYEIEHRVRTKSGGWEWVVLRGKVVVEDEQGNPLRVAGIHQNITARKRAEEALRDSQQRLAAHVQHTPLAYIEWDADLRVVEWNPAAERIFGYTKNEAANCHAYEIIVPPEVQPHVTQVWQSLLSQTGGMRSTNENVTKDGRTIICEWYNTPLIDEDGNVIGLASLVEDITERVQAEAGLREAKEAAEAANRAKSTFLANMSHEVRTPLNAILGFAQLMTRDPTLTPELQENLAIIGRSGEHLLGLINDVLEMSKIEAGRVTAQKQSFDLYLMLDGLEEMFHLRAREKGLVLSFDRAPDVPQFVQTDQGKLRQVLMNLLGNAVKFTQEGGITLRIKYDDQPTKRTSQLGFEVEDTGPGIVPGELEAVFDPFVQTTSGQRSQEGTGLGLPISRQFVRLLGGDLTLHSELGRGSVFRFDVGVELADAAEVQTAQPERRVVGLERGQPAYRLLVAEDREGNRKLLVNLLAPIGFEVREAVNGEEAIQVWEQWEPHLIWMDLRMPVMDGYEATKRIKSTTQGQATVIVALTASAFEEDRAVILSQGCDDFLRKPFREGEIFDALARHLGVRFVYEEEDVSAAIARPRKTKDVLTPDALAALPAEWVAKLHQAATQLDADVILGLLDRIRDDYAALADGLATLVRDFRFDTIIAVTQAAEDGNEQHIDRPAKS